MEKMYRDPEKQKKDEEKAEKQRKKDEEKAAKQKKIDDKAAKIFTAKSEEYKSGKKEPIDLLDLLLSDPPFKTSDLKLKQDTFLMVLKTFCKLKGSQLKDLLAKLDEDKAVDLLKY